MKNLNKTSLFFIGLALFVNSKNLLANEVLPKTCYQSSNEVVTNFVQTAIQDPDKAASFFTEKTLHNFRGKLEQLLDDRYSPDSSAFRNKLLGEAWTMDQLRSASDVDLVTLQERTFFGQISDGCWKLDVPTEAWVRLDQISKILKTSRTEPSLLKNAASKLKLQVAKANQSYQNGMEETFHKNDFGQTSKIWIEKPAILTDEDIVGVSANWACEAGLGPEQASVRIKFNERAARRLKSWSEKNLGEMLAIVVDGETFTFARIAEPLGASLNMCLKNSTLQQAQAIANGLVGK